MTTTIEAVINENGTVFLQTPVKLQRARRAFVIILDENPSLEITNLSETALLSESALAKDWNRKEEDEAWAHLQRGMLS